MFDDHKDAVKQLKVQIRNLETELNNLVETFQKETGIPVLIEVSGFESQHIGQTPRQKINVSGFIYERL